MIFKRPVADRAFAISAAPSWPSVIFETDGDGPHTWTWSIIWGAYRKAGSGKTAGNTWNARSVITNLGGTLAVRAEAKTGSAEISVVIGAINPTRRKVIAYLATKSNATGFARILERESGFKHFNAKSQPLRSFDDGYGMCQLTNPAPTFEQIWNWKLNIDGGLALFEQKRIAAIAYLGQADRTYTPEQLEFESVCRWNGGSYHEWDLRSGAWVRTAKILCDSQTGNIGWDTTDPQNQGKTEAELHERDSGDYSKPPSPSAHWKYCGVCYADRLLR
jgi:hypothetical protein